MNEREFLIEFCKELEDLFEIELTQGNNIIALESLIDRFIANNELYSEKKGENNATCKDN